jgi:alpha-N-acetylglucosaminidase
LIKLDFYGMEEPWTKAHNYYSSNPVGNPIDVAKKVFHEALVLHGKE